MTDAVHMLADVVGILFSLLALWLSTKPPTKRFTFGLHRLGKSQMSDAFTLLLSTTPLSLSCPVLCETDGYSTCGLMNHVKKKMCVQQCSSQIRFQIGYTYMQIIEISDSN